MRYIVLLGCLAVVLTLSACSTTGGKTYLEPADVYGQQCTTDCRTVRTQCRANAQQGYKRCRQEYEWRERQHAACVAQGGTFCIKPERCRPARTEHCQMQYDGCFQSCGGQIEIPEDA